MKQLDMEFKNEIGKTKHMCLNHSQNSDVSNRQSRAQYIDRTVMSIFGGEVEVADVKVTE